MYRYVQSLEFSDSLKKYTNLIDQKSLNNFLRDLPNSPRKAKGAHSLHFPFSRFNIWSAHFSTKGCNFFTVLYLICDNTINSCLGGREFCKIIIPKCEKPTDQIYFWRLELGEPYDKLSKFFYK